MYVFYRRCWSSWERGGVRGHQSCCSVRFQVAALGVTGVRRLLVHRTAEHAAHNQDVGNWAARWGLAALFVEGFRRSAVAAYAVSLSRYDS